MTAAVKERPKGKQQAADDLVGKFRRAREGIAGSLIERDEEVDLMFAALLCGEHVCFRGDAGTAKSKMVDSLIASIEGAVPFDILMSKFTDPVETEGPLDVNELLKGNYLRHNGTYMTSADIIFMDEVFKASSAILNTLLKLINERKYRNGGQWHSSPLISVFGASNEWPVGDQYHDVAQAFFDRFLIRKDVERIGSPKGLSELMFEPDYRFSCEMNVLHLSDIHFAADAVKMVEVVDPAITKIQEIVRELNGKGIQPGDRRLRKSVKACQAVAWLAGSDEVHPQHLGILSHTLWVDPAHAKETAKIVDKIADPDRHAVASERAIAEEVFAKCEALFAGAEKLPPDKMQDFFGEIHKTEDCVKRLTALGSSAAIKQAKEWMAKEIRRLRMKSIGEKE
jgi:MoxR-like ATPase